VRVRGGSLQVRVFAGVDPVTGKDRYLSVSVKGTDRAARREAEKAMGRLQAEVDGQRSAQSSVTLGHTLDEWLKTMRGGEPCARSTPAASVCRAQSSSAVQ
jgi:integrase